MHYLKINCVKGTAKKDTKQLLHVLGPISLDSICVKNMVISTYFKNLIKDDIYDFFFKNAWQFP